jgi:1-acyl-sn-glycerol-3-phosphate acyltransferase
MITDIFGLLYLFWPFSVGSIVLCFLCGLLFAINIGSFLFGFVLILYYVYNYLKRKGVFSWILRWISEKTTTVSKTLEENIQKTFVIKGDVPKDPVLYVAHPHGLFSMAPFLHWAVRITNWPPDQTICIAVHSIFFKIPIVCELMEAYGAIEATEEAIRAKLTEGVSVAVLTGGIREIHETHPGKMKLVLRPRKGVFRISQDLQIPIVPVLTFGENELFPPMQSAWMQRAQKYLRSWFGIALPFPTLASIKNWFRLLQAPLEPQVITWIGRPIHPDKKKLVDFQGEIFVEFQRVFTSGKPPDYTGDLEIL